ncbi:MAG TPA: hypothetical protein DEP18_01290 [Flavobacteriales bacterium]|mgnify:CR=1 FL=1|nr:hypothetical protein [Flavobacteriales bacterium]HRE74093.1 hypothetical protein [Flavobacteriales bacterium]HRJ36771.1 hypothetical protein [Flavobacteriales bacterium]HRJ39785.1 hypothetical protein [Flavobacteriales bacterium]
MKMYFSRSLFLLVLVVTLFSSCKKRRDGVDLIVARDQGTAEACFNDLKNIADEAFSGQLFLYRGAQDTLVHGCATVIRDTSANPKTIVVDFGSANCQCNDGKNRRGKINITYTGLYRDPGTIITLTPDQYFVNDHQLIGTKTVTNEGRNTNNNLWYSIVVNGQVVKPNNGGTITINSTRQREWTEGESTVLNWLDDVYLITGYGNGVASNGEAYTVAIVIPLRKEMSCYHFVSGSIRVLPGSRPERLIDFGAGTCDNSATITVNGTTYPVSLY